VSYSILLSVLNGSAYHNSFPHKEEVGSFNGQEIVEKMLT